MEKSQKQNLNKVYFPTNKNGNFYNVPITIKNKDYLIGYLRGMYFVMDSINLVGTRITLNLNSSRFNGIVGNNGEKIISNNDFDEIINYNHPEKKDGILDPSFLELHCVCGNYYRFNNEFEIPDKNLICGLCDNYLIFYTGFTDNEIQPE